MSNELLEKAEAGDMESQCQMALLYEIGIGHPIDYQKAYQWWRKAADQGSPWALKKIGDLIKAGHIEPADQKEATMWLTKASEAGYESLDDFILKKQRQEKMRSVTKLNIKILVIDDEKPLRDIMSTMLSTEGFTPIVAENGKAALDALGNNPDIAFIFVDLQMPHMNGFQFIQTLRNMKAAEGTPIVVVTANTKPEYISRGKKLGVQGWIMKPFKFEKIIESVTETLKLDKKSA